jgi:hypothetical protein
MKYSAALKIGIAKVVEYVDYSLDVEREKEIKF